MNKAKKVLAVVIVTTLYLAYSQTPKITTPARTNSMAMLAMEKTSNANSFAIPPSLIHRMEEAFNALRKRLLRTNIDVQELFASDGRGGKFPNAHLIAARPKSEMRFCNDCMNEKEREELWPFDVEGLEKSLEAKMVRDKDGLFRLKGIFAQEASLTNDDGHVASYPTIRWVNQEIEQWLIKQLDREFKRMDGAAFCKMSEDEKIQEDSLAWKLDDRGEFFAIQRCDGAWNRREYRYVVKVGKRGCLSQPLTRSPTARKLRPCEHTGVMRHLTTSRYSSGDTEITG